MALAIAKPLKTDGGYMETQPISLAVLMASVLAAMCLVILPPERLGAAPAARATFAGGCFWCMEPAFDKVEGVLSTTVGYTGGHKENPTYEEVSSGVTGHAEAVEVLYDPGKVSYEQLLEVFWRNVDPTVKDRQFCDVGSQYRTAIFYHDEEQRSSAQESMERLRHSGRFPQIFTELVPASTFWPAEDYHQDYYRKNPLRYNLYRRGCGRDQRIRELWGGK
jgi:peptide-methionine (S)-S-oxide reductase